MKITSIIIIVVLLWQVIGAIVQAAAKKQKEQTQKDRLKDLASSQRNTDRGAAVDPAPSRRPQASASPTAQARSQDLAGRRKAQLDELRRRRAEKTQAKVGSAPPRTRPTFAPSPLPSASRPKPGRQPIREVGASLKAVQAAEDAERKRRVDSYQQDMATDAAKGRRVKLEVDREIVARKAKTARATQKGEPDAYAQRRRRRPGVVLAGRLKDPTTLRELIVLREILDAPLALRGGT